MSHLKFSKWHFQQFCPIKIDLSDNTVWPQASGVQKLAKLAILGIWINFYLPVECDFFFSNFQTVQKSCDFTSVRTDRHMNTFLLENVMQDLNEEKMPHLAKMREWQCDLVPYVSLHTNTCEKDLAAIMQKGCCGLWPLLPNLLFRVCQYA